MAVDFRNSQGEHFNATAFLAIEEDMDAGKGYGTILRKILTVIDKGDSSES
jgi:hypothetical protein